MKANLETDTKECPKCGREQDLAKFGRARRYADGLRSWCDDCEAEYNRKYREEHRTELREAAFKRRDKLVEESQLEANEIFDELKDDPEFKALQMML